MQGELALVAFLIFLFVGIAIGAGVRHVLGRRK
jgi:hypothetical protein